ncbi:MAG TPA: hypothetical protein VJN65_06410 [Bacteroidota bacterium]|nr:hypothetical protein [Bacteroidota bacterium]
MVPIMSLWLPILLSAVFVFIASSVIHMMLSYHKSDYKKLPDEDATIEALRKFSIPPGEYVIPYAGSSKAMTNPTFIEKCKKGPVGFFTVMQNGMPGMGAQLFQWFVYCVVVGIFAAYVAGRALDPGAPYLAVHRFAGVMAFAAYGLALVQNSIWYKRGWSTTLKSLLDALIYGSITGGTFGWLWPAA